MSEKPLHQTTVGILGERSIDAWKERNLRRVDIEGMSVMVLREDAMAHLDKVGRKLAIAKLALWRIRKAGAGNYESNLADNALEEIQNV